MQQQVCRRRFTARHDRLRRVQCPCERGGIALPLRLPEPHGRERRLHAHVVGMPLRRAAEHECGHVRAPRLGSRHREGNIPLGAVRLESGQRLELFDAVGLPVEIVEEIRECLARWHEARRQSHGTLERPERLRPLLLGAEADAEQVIALREPVVQAHGLPERGHRRSRVPVRVQRESPFVEQARRAVVEAKVGLVTVGGPGELALSEVHVTELFQRARGGAVQHARLPQVANRGGEVSVPAIGLAPFQVAEHRARLQGNGAAERLDAEECLSRRQRAITGLDQLAVLPVPGGRVPGEGSGNRQQGDEDPDEQQPFHGRTCPIF